MTAKFNRPRSPQASVCLPLALTLVATLAACTEAGPESADDELGYALVLPGKADDYFSNVAREYELIGTIPVEMTEAEHADEATRDRLIAQRTTAVGLYLTTWLTDKFEGIDINGDGEISDDEIFFRNLDYGGFHAMVRNRSLELLAIEPSSEPGRFDVSFALDIAGPRELMSLLLSAGAREHDGGLELELVMPEGATSDPDFVNRRAIRNFHPDTYDGALERVRLELRPLPDLSDAYPHYAAFMADGVYDITMVFGHDYNASRSDLREAREAFEHLVWRGFEAPAATFEELRHDSGPFVRTLRVRADGAEGPERRDVRVEVRLFHSEMFEGERGLQRELVSSELVSRDVFFYNGHAGPYYGFYLDADGLAQISDRDFARLPFEPDRQQLVIAQGCQTYSQYADMLYAHPERDEERLDVITTVNYSYGIGTLGLLDRLTRTDAAGVHRPESYDALVSGLNAEYWNERKQVFYGVMGIETNPALHPWANVDAIGRFCRADSDCGEHPDANVCVPFSDGRSRCTVRTVAERGCPADTRYAYLASGRTLVGGVCWGL
jgi:hypothetical protein